MSKIYYFSHSRSEADSTCERARYWGSEWGGTGLEPTQSGWDQLFGSVIHNWLNVLAIDGQIDYVAARIEFLAHAKLYMTEQMAKDWAALGEGLMRGFVRSVWRLLMEEYEIIESEKLHSFVVEAPFVFRFKQDLLLRHKKTGHLHMVDYKTTSSDQPQWITSWTKSPQLHSSMLALKMANGLEIESSSIIGLYKGYKDKKTKQIQSIFSRGWVNREFAMSPSYSYTTKWGKGWEKFSTFDEFDDLKTWVANMPEEILLANYPQTQPIGLNLHIAEAFFRQQLIREREVAHGLALLSTAQTPEYVEDKLDQFFRQDFNQCTPAWGYGCRFVPLCWEGPWVKADPLGSGQYRRRELQYEDGEESDAENS